MPTLTPYHLTFPHGLHVGRGVENLAESRVCAPSDTLYAALLSTWRLTGRAVSVLLAGEEAEMPFRLTSAFPFSGGARFYPMPVDLRAVFSEDKLRSLGASKEARNIHYLSEELLELARTGKKLDDWLPGENPDTWKGLFLQGGSLWLKTEEVQELPPLVRNKRDKNGNLTDRPLPLHALPRQKVWREHTVPRVTVDRISSAPNLFQSERTLFTEGCGLWFGASGQTDELPSLLAALGESGLGGERTAGYGKFTIDPKQQINFPDLGAAQVSYLLSRYHPRAGEVGLMKNDSASYRLEVVDGYLQSFDGAAQRRKRIWLVSEGCLLPGDPKGNSPDVRPEYYDKNNPRRFIPGVAHPVYRPGFALAVGWIL